MPTQPADLIVTTGSDVAGHRIARYLGVVRGLTVRSPSFGAALSGAFKTLGGGGDITEFVEVCEAARQKAYDLMLEHAANLGADAIIAMRYDATDFLQSATEVLCYGTAVKLEPTVDR
jgi:uncharacterized protein YbjQ (UPF0145 family)